MKMAFMCGVRRGNFMIQGITRRTDSPPSSSSAFHLEYVDTDTF